MKLNGIAKDRFEEHYNTSTQKFLLNNIEFDDLPLTCQNALIIDWFSTLKYKGRDFWLFVFEFYYEMRIDNLTINDINLQAIEKANEIFNELNK